MNNITTHTITVPTPDGGEADIDITVHWEHDMNPCDKDPCHYRGEEDGWTATDVELGHNPRPSAAAAVAHVLEATEGEIKPGELGQDAKVRRQQEQIRRDAAQEGLL